MIYRDVMLTIVILALLPACFVRPWIGVLVWTWIGVMNPHRLTWGFAATTPFAMMVAIATLAGLPLTKDRFRLPWTREVCLLFGLWLVFLVSTIGALYPADAWQQLEKVSKIFLMTVLVIVLLQNAERVRLLIWVIVLSIGFYGTKGGIWALATGGHNQVLGPPGTFIEGNTEIGLAMNMALPLMVFLRRDATNRWIRHGLTAMVFFTAVAVVFTYSRGALLGLAAVIALLLLKSRGKIFMVIIVGALVYAGSGLIPQGWFGRMQTIQTYEADASAMSRIYAWELSTKLFADHPLFGAGFRPFTEEIYRKYLPHFVEVAGERSHDAHSIFFQVLAEHGITGFGLYVALLVSMVVTLRSIMRRASRRPDQRWIYDCAQMVEASVAAYAVTGMFLSLSYFDVFYHLVAITVILKVLVARAPEEAPERVVVAPAPLAKRFISTAWRPF